MFHTPTTRATIAALLDGSWRELMHEQDAARAAAASAPFPWVKKYAAPRQPHGE